MKIMTNPRICRYLARAIIFLVVVVLIAGMVSCHPLGCVPFVQILTIDSTEGGSVT